MKILLNMIQDKKIKSPTLEINHEKSKLRNCDKTLKIFKKILALPDMVSQKIPTVTDVPLD